MPSGKVLPREILCKSALTKTGIPGYDYCLNPYVGCTHACVYCYASFMCRFSGHREKWGQFVDVKTNIPGVLAKKLSGRARPAGKVLFGTVTDAYQPAEAHYKITRSCLELLTGYGQLEVHILTKSSLVQRDLPVLQQLKYCEVGFTITTLDQAIAGVMEPGAPPPGQRLAASRKLIKAGIPVWVFVAPLLPGLSDTYEALEKLINALHNIGIGEILIDPLNPYPAVIYRLKSAYRRHFPEALPKLREYLNNPLTYRKIINGLLHQISQSTDCRVGFI